MAISLRCPNCQDNLGKDTENCKVAHCGNCDHQFYNDRGFTEDLTDEEKKWLKKNTPKKRPLVRFR